MKQLTFFLLSGGVALSLNWLSRFVFSLWMPFEFAIVAAFLVGLFSAFMMMRYFVFEGAGKPVFPQASTFLMVNLLGLLQTLAISVILEHWFFPSIGILDQTEAVSHLVGLVVPVFTSYFAHRFLTFR